MSFDSGVISFKKRVTREQAMLPVDKIIVALEKSLSRRQIRRALDQGGVTLNGKRVRVASAKPRPGDVLEFRCWPDTTGSKSSKGKIPGTDGLATALGRDHILLNKEGLLFINKPPLLASQPTKNPRDTFVIRELEKLSAKEAEFNASGIFLCHRLDKETSGVLMLADSAKLAESMMDQFRGRKIKKKYLALCYGIPSEKAWEKRCFLSPIDKKTGNVRVVRSGGKDSLTSFRLLEAWPSHNISLVACFPETGRGHQIRVHLEACGHPILGDKRYGFSQPPPLPPGVEKHCVKHHMLHAEKLGFFAGDSMQWVDAPLPPSFAEILKFLRG